MPGSKPNLTIRQSGKFVANSMMPMAFHWSERFVMSADGRNRAVTDINGFYNLQVVQGTTLSYQSVGYTMETMNISSPVMNVSLAPAMAMLDTVTIAEEVADESESLFGRASSRRREADQDLSFVAVDIAHSPTQTRFNVAATYDIPSDGHPHAVRIQDHSLEADYLHHVPPSSILKCTSQRCSQTGKILI